MHVLRVTLPCEQGELARNIESLRGWVQYDCIIRSNLQFAWVLTRYFRILQKSGVEKDSIVQPGFPLRFEESEVLLVRAQSSEGGRSTRA